MDEVAFTAQVMLEAQVEELRRKLGLARSALEHIKKNSLWGVEETAQKALDLTA